MLFFIPLHKELKASIQMILRIKEICRDKKMSIGALAAQVGVVRESLSRIISSGSTSTDMLQKIADALGVPITDLFEKEGDFVAFVRRNGVTHTFSTERELAAFVASFEGCVELDATTKP